MAGERARKAAQKPAVGGNTINVTLSILDHDPGRGCGRPAETAVATRPRAPGGRALTLGVALVLALASSGCAPTDPELAEGPVPLTNPTDIPFAPPPGVLEARAVQVERAVVGEGWVATSRAPGRVLARKEDGPAFAEVLVTYDAQRFSIHYAHSQGLHYDGRWIDAEYQDAVERLRRAIVAQSSV